MKIKAKVQVWPKVATLIPGEVYENTLTGGKYLGYVAADNSLGIVNLTDGKVYGMSEIDLRYLRARPDAVLTFTEES